MARHGYAGRSILRSIMEVGSAYRLELFAAAIAWYFWVCLDEVAGPVAAWTGMAAVVVAVVSIPELRKRVAPMFSRSRVRRQWRRSVGRAGIGAFGGNVPAVKKIQTIPAGERLTVRVPLGGCVGQLEDAREMLAAGLGVRDVRVRRDPNNARWADVSIVRRDPLHDASVGSPWPWRDYVATDLWDPIPVGVDEDGDRVSISLPERHVLIGGEPGAGKSNALAQLVSAAALDPSTRLWLLDGKLVELAPWAGCAEHNVGVSVSEAVDVLRLLQRDMETRYAELLACRQRKVLPGDGLPLHVVVCDELAHYLSAPDKGVRQAFTDSLRDLVSRGRAAGIIVLAATQKPGSDVVPTSLRDLFGIRWAMRCTTPQASDTILGAGWATAGVSASSIDAGNRGVGYLLQEGCLPIRLRAHYVADDELAGMSQRAEHARVGRCVHVAG